MEALRQNKVSPEVARLAIDAASAPEKAAKSTWDFRLEQMQMHAEGSTDPPDKAEAHAWFQERKARFLTNLKWCVAWVVIGFIATSDHSWAVVRWIHAGAPFLAILCLAFALRQALRIPLPDTPAETNQ